MRNHAQPRLCAAVVLYNPNPDHLARLVAGLGDFPLMAFANGRLDTAARDVLSLLPLRLQESAMNIGLGAGLNTLIEIAREEGFSHVFLLDQDSEPTPALMEALLSQSMDNDMPIGITAPLLIPPGGEGYRPIRYAWRGAATSQALRAAHFVPTSGSLLTLEAFAEVGPFRDDFFIAGLDVEWGFRAWQHGWGSYVATGVHMPHRWGEPVIEGTRNIPQILRHAPVRNYYYVRNVLATARLGHVPWRWRLTSCFTLAAQITILGLKGSSGALRPVFAGVADAISGRMGPAPARITQRNCE